MSDDILNTQSFAAPHNSTISSNIYLLKKQPFTPPKGNVAAVISSNLPEELPDGVWWAAFDRAMKKEVFQEACSGEVSSEAVVHLYGYSLTFSEGAVGVLEEEGGAVLSHLYLIPGEKAEELGGAQLGTFQDREIFGKKFDVQGDIPEDLNTTEWLETLTEATGYPLSQLVYYLYRVGIHLPEDLMTTPEPVEHPNLLDKFDLKEIPAINESTGELAKDLRRVTSEELQEEMNQVNKEVEDLVSST